MDNPAKRIYTIRTDSRNQKAIRAKIKEIGMDKIDVLHIDGWHSVNAVLNDWRYVDMLAPGGVVIMHDTNVHPGPKCVFDAVDERLFRKCKYFQDDADNGMAVCEHLL